jgi:tetratricopeptide (TPR) repeat protein
MDPKGNFQAIREADQNDQTGYVRHLCERFLLEHPDHGPALLRYSRNLITLGAYAEAQAALDHAEKVVPPQHLHLVIARRGHLLEAQGRFDQAEEMFMEAHRLDPDDATYLIYAGGAASRRGDLELALELHTRATHCAEGCIDEAHFNRGGKLLALKRYDEAAEAYREALRLDPDYDIAKERLEDVERILADEKVMRTVPKGSSSGE